MSPTFKNKNVFGGPLGVGELQACCSICGKIAPVSSYRHTWHPITENVCEKCWEKAPGWCFDCALPLVKCCGVPRVEAPVVP